MPISSYWHPPGGANKFLLPPPPGGANKHFLYVMATSFFYIYVMATSFFYIYKLTDKKVIDIRNGFETLFNTDPFFCKF